MTSVLLWNERKQHLLQSLPRCSKATSSSNGQHSSHRHSLSSSRSAVAGPLALHLHEQECRSLRLA